MHVVCRTHSVKPYARMTLLLAIKCRYEKPTAIQAQALPAALSGRDVLVSKATVFTCKATSNPHALLRNASKNIFALNWCLLLQFRITQLRSVHVLGRGQV